jgi:uracil-DNA glycosylase family 4
MTDSLKIIAEEINKCKKCPLHEGTNCAVPGEGPQKAKLFIIGQAPGAQEDKTGRPFIGRAGKYLTMMLEKIGIKREEVFITSTVKHFPPKNRPPTEEEMQACRPYLLRQLETVNPKIVLLLGNSAKSVKQHLKGKIIFEAIHPSAAMRFKKMAQRMDEEFSRLKEIYENTP